MDAPRDFGALDAGAARPAGRRSRAELEQLAAQFVGGQPSNAPTAASRPRWLLAAGAVVPLLAAAGWLLMTPRAEQAAPRAEPVPAADPSREWLRRLEAERERNRQLAAAGGYLDRVAEQDRAVLQEMSESAQRLADRAAPAEPETTTEATDREASAPTPGTDATAPPATEPPVTEPGTPAAVAAATPGTENAAPPASEPVRDTVAAAAAPARPVTGSAEPTAARNAPQTSCRIHVSELSKSGKLTYDQLARMQGVRLDKESGRLTTPPVPVSGGRSVIFEITRDGCARVVRSVYGR